MKGLLSVIALLVAFPTAVLTQTATLRGHVRAADGSPVAGANVFVVGTLNGGLSDSAGAFRFVTTAAGPLHLAVKRLGFRDGDVTVSDPGHEIDVVLQTEATRVGAVTVQASRYVAGDET